MNKAIALGDGGAFYEMSDANLGLFCKEHRLKWFRTVNSAVLHLSWSHGQRSAAGCSYADERSTGCDSLADKWMRWFGNCTRRHNFSSYRNARISFCPAGNCTATTFRRKSTDTATLLPKMKAMIKRVSRVS